MRRLVLVLLVLAASEMLPAAAAVAVPPAQSASAGVPGDDVRGLWVLRTSLGSAASIRQMVDTAKRGGFNTLLVQVRGRGEAYYASDIEPPAAELADDAGLDPLALTLSLAHAAGLKVHAWFNVDLVASAAALPRSRAHVVSLHPEWLMVPRPLAARARQIPPDSPAYVGEIARWTRGMSDRVEGLYLSPVTRASRDYTASVARELVAKYALDGIHFDYMRYPSDQFDYSVAALDEFRTARQRDVAPAERERLDRAAVQTATAWADAFPEAWAQFRRDRLTDLVAGLRAAVLAARPSLTISAAVAPDADEARSGRLQDWRLWARTRLIDVICPMVYTTDADAFTTSLVRVTADAAPAAVWAGIGAYRLSPARTTENVKAARHIGAGGVLVFSYDSLIAADAPPNYFALIRPALLEAFNASSGR